MELKISNNAKKYEENRVSISQQQLVNSLLSEKQPTQPQPQNIQPANIQNVSAWGGKK